jgi:hypothetical protein
MDGPQSNSPSDPLAILLDGMIAHRNEVCQEFALTVDHKHCIGCTLVMDYMKQHHPSLEYGTQEQWIEESAFCALHERQLFADYLKSRGVGNVSKT